MGPFLYGFTDELIKLGVELPVPGAKASGGQFKFKVNKPTGPAGPVARPKPFGFGGGPTSSALKAIGRQQMTLGPGRKRKADYIPVGRQKFKAEAPPKVAPKPKKGRGGRRKQKDLGPTYGDLNKLQQRKAGDLQSKGRMQGKKDQDWFEKQTPKSTGGARKGLSSSEQSRYDRLQSMGVSGRHEAATGAKRKRKERDVAVTAATALAKKQRSERIRRLQASAPNPMPMGGGKM